MFGETLTRLAGEDRRICALTAAMVDGTGLTKFSKTYPSRFFDVGIAEGHAVATAAGMAKQGLVPVLAVFLILDEPLYYMLGSDDLLLPYCVDYGKIVIPGSILMSTVSALPLRFPFLPSATDRIAGDGLTVRTGS